MSASHSRCLVALLAALVLTSPALAQDAGALPLEKPAPAETQRQAPPPSPPVETDGPSASEPKAEPRVETQIDTQVNTQVGAPPEPEPPPPPRVEPEPKRETPPSTQPPAQTRKAPAPTKPPPLDDEARETPAHDDEEGHREEGDDDIGEGEPEEASPPGHAATYHEQPSPLVFRVPARGRSPEVRARAATTALTEALDEKREGDHADATSTEPEVLLEDGHAVVRVGQHVITTLYPEDARAEGMTLERYAPHIESRLDAFIDSQLQRQAFQLFFLHLFLSVLFGVIGFLTLRGLRNAFDRWDAELDDRRGSFKPISVLRIPVFSGEALASGLAFGLAVGRVLAYVATVIATVVAVLSQFELTRPLLRRLVSWSAGPVLNGVEAVITALPGIILAAILVVGLRAGLRVLNILLDGVASKRVTWQRLPPERVPVFRFSATAGAVLLAAPLLVAAAFGRWGTPLETLALAAGLAVIVAAVPLVASYVVGVFMLWRAALKPGDWVQVGGVSGEVTRLGLSELHLVPETGGTIAIPMLYLLLHPLQRLRQSPAVSFEITVARDRPARELLAALKKAVQAVESDAQVEIVDLCAAWIKARVSAPAVREGVRQQIMIAVSDAVDRDEFALPTRHGPDR